LNIIEILSIFISGVGVKVNIGILGISDARAVLAHPTNVLLLPYSVTA
jgi:hypothetical protein